MEGMHIRKSLWQGGWGNPGLWCLMLNFMSCELCYNSPSIVPNFTKLCSTHTNLMLMVLWRKKEEGEHRVKLRCLRVEDPVEKVEEGQREHQEECNPSEAT